jgi:hypothetical protein
MVVTMKLNVTWKIASLFAGAQQFHHHLISHFLCCTALLALTKPVQTDDPRLCISASGAVNPMFSSTSLALCSRCHGTNAKTKVAPCLVVSFAQDSATPGQPRATTLLLLISTWRQCSQEARKAEHFKRLGCGVYCTAWRVEGDSPIQPCNSLIFATSLAAVAQAEYKNNNQQRQLHCSVSTTTRTLVQERHQRL